MKYFLLSLPLLASATLAAARETSLDPTRLWAERPVTAATPSAGAPPWLTGALDERLIAESAADDPHAAIGDPHGHYHEAEHGVYPEDVDHGAYHDHDHDHAGDDPHALYHADEDGSDPHGALLDVPEVEPLARATGANARNVAEIVGQRAALDGGVVRVHARVVKLTEGILGKTYLHLRDGSGSAAAGDHDLTATTTEPFELGETVEVEGRVMIDQDIGLGYRYAVLLAETRRVTARRRRGGSSW